MPTLSRDREGAVPGHETSAGQFPEPTKIPGDDIRSSEDLLGLLTAKRVLVLKQLKETPSSISMLARKLNRDRSAVTRDVRMLERFGVVQVTEKPLPGHGKQKWVTPLAGEIKLTAVL